MADNITLPGTGQVIATDDDGVAQHQYTKMEWGAGGTRTKVSTGTASVPVQGAAAAASAIAGNPVLAGGSDGTNARALAVTTGGLLKVDDGGGTITVDQATAANLNVQAVGEVAHGSSDSGNPQKIGAKAKASLAGVTLVSADQRSDVFADVDGALLMKQMCPWGDIKQQRTTSTVATTTALTTFGAVASTRNFITTICVYNSSTTGIYIDFQDGSGGTAFFTVGVPPGGGCVVNLPVPLRQPTANTGLYFQCSSGVSTIYLSVVGFQSKA